jgi:hypothetical protein
MSAGFAGIMEISGVWLSSASIPASPASRTLKAYKDNDLTVKANETLKVYKDNDLVVK